MAADRPDAAERFGGVKAADGDFVPLKNQPPSAHALNKGNRGIASLTRLCLPVDQCRLTAGIGFASTPMCQCEPAWHWLLSTALSKSHGQKGDQ